MFTNAPKTICIFFLFFAFTVNGQTSSFAKDSLKLESLIDGMDTFYKDPFHYRNTIPKAYQLVNKMLQKHPENIELKRKRTHISDLYFTFKRQELNFEEGLKILLENIQERKELKDSCELSKSYRDLGVFWRIQKNYKKSLEFIDESYKIAKECKDEKSLVRTLASYGIYYHVLGEYDKAKDYFLQALQLSKKINYTGGIANSSWSIYRIYSLKKDYKNGLPYLKKAEEGFKKTQNISSLEKITAAYGSYYRKSGKPQKAIPYFKQAIDYNLKLKDSSRLMYRYLGISNAYVQLKDYKNAYYNYLNYKGLQKKIDNKKHYRKLVEIETRMAYKNQKALDSIHFAQQKTLDEQKIKQKANSRFWWVVASLSFIVLLIGIAYWVNRQRIREQAYQNILLNKKVATKTEEIQELLNETMKHIRSKEKIASNLQKISREEGGNLQSVIADLKASKADDTKLLLIKENIEKINFEFLKSLKAKHPNLTKTEIEVCSFIKMGLSRKEIAEVRGTSDFAVKTMRNRIRKKIGIDSSITLNNYLNSL
ncbi:tetratricopeptide repeat protein [Pseudotenacibaculum haliotis]|uniref:Tetratricopeptide repeat protein n=1 Tax=Pseudotenacibaculum haliotis TaxID=1862138 RepID=A0ABW5LQV8_9FLAO